MASPKRSLDVEETVGVASAPHEAERMPDMLKVAAVGAALGFLGAVGIYFAPEEPYPGYITVAGTLSGVIIALLITTVVTRNRQRPHTRQRGCLTC